MSDNLSEISGTHTHTHTQMKWLIVIEVETEQLSGIHSISTETRKTLTQ